VYKGQGRHQHNPMTLCQCRLIWRIHHVHHKSDVNAIHRNTMQNDNWMNETQSKKNFSHVRIAAAEQYTVGCLTCITWCV